MKSKLSIAIVILCIVGAIFSGISLRNHYSTSPTGYCDLDETFNCDLVNRSIYARFAGVPVALIGLVGYLSLIALSFFSGRRVDIVRLLASMGGLGFALHLAYIEARILAVWCLLCIASLIAIGGIFVLSAVAVWRNGRSRRADPPRTELSHDERPDEA